MITCNSKVVDDGYDGKIGELDFEFLDGNFLGDDAVVGSVDFTLSEAYFTVDGGDFVRESGIWDED